MSYTKLEQFILLGLKARYREAVAHGSEYSAPAGSVEELWRAVDNAYCYWNTVAKTATVKDINLVKEGVLSVVGCTEADLRVAIKTLIREELIAFDKGAFEEVKKEKKARQPEEGQAYLLLPRGFRACREFECPV